MQFKTTLPSPNKIHNPPPAEVTHGRCLQVTKTPKPSMYQLDRSVDSTARRWQIMILKTYFKVFWFKITKPLILHTYTHTEMTISTPRYTSHNKLGAAANRSRQQKLKMRQEIAGSTAYLTLRHVTRQWGRHPGKGGLRNSNRHSNVRPVSTGGRQLHPGRNPHLLPGQSQSR